MLVEQHHFAGLRILFDPNALADTTQRLFAASSHRSRRVRKKLIKRFGGEFLKEPAMFRHGGTVIAHPSFRAALTPEKKD